MPTSGMKILMVSKSNASLMWEAFQGSSSRFHSQDRWLELGRRHWFGAIGNSAPRFDVNTRAKSWKKQAQSLSFCCG